MTKHNYLKFDKGQQLFFYKTKTLIETKLKIKQILRRRKKSKFYNTKNIFNHLKKIIIIKINRTKKNTTSESQVM